MATTHIYCAYCQFGMEVPEEIGGGFTTCPRCKRRVFVPPVAKPDAPPAPPNLLAAGEKQCPSCGVTMFEDATFCVACGFNKRTGRHVGELVPDRAQYAQVILLVLGAVIAVGLFWVWSRHAKSRPATLPAVETTTLLSQAVSLRDNALAAVTNELEGVDRPPPTPVAAELVMAPAPTVDVARIEADIRLRLSAQFDQRYPMFKLGETIAVRRTTGQITRGAFEAAVSNAVMIRSGGGQVAVPFAELDQNTRARCDSRYRESVIESRVRRKIAGLEK